MSGVAETRRPLQAPLLGSPISPSLVPVQDVDNSAHRGASSGDRRRKCVVGSCVVLGVLAWLGLLCFGVAVVEILRQPALGESDEFSDDLRGGVVWYQRGNRGGGTFDKTKRTVVLCHDREGGSVARRHLPSFNGKANDPKNGKDMDFADAWLDDGWNVGLFYWDQFADEPNLADTEAKVWTADGPQAMRWRTSDGRWHNAPFNTSLSERLADDLREQMAGFDSALEFRLVGHGVGAQLATATAHLLFMDSQFAANPLLPTRLTLLDPYYTDDSRDYLDASTSTEMVSLLHQLKNQEKKIAIEAYRCSFFQALFGGTPSQLYAETVYVQMHLSDIIPFDVKGRHRACPNVYFWSYNNREPPVEIDADGTDNGHVAPSARLDTSVLEEDLRRTIPSSDSPVWIQRSPLSVGEYSCMEFKLEPPSRLPSPLLQRTAIALLVAAGCTLEALVTLLAGVVVVRQFRSLLRRADIEPAIMFDD